METDADITLAAVEAQSLVRMELTQLLAFGVVQVCRLGTWLGRDWFHAMVTCASDPVMQTSTGTTHALLAVATGVRGFLLLALLTHLTQRRSTARGVFGVVHVQVEIGLKMATVATITYPSEDDVRHSVP